MDANPAPVHIRTARPDDATSIATIARITWPDTYKGLIPEAVQQTFLNRAYSPGSLARAIGRDDHWFFVAETNGSVVGFAEFGPAPADDTIDADRAEDIELYRVYVHPLAQRSGAGSALLEAGIAAIRALDGGPHRLFLHVEEGNEKGMRFYERHGFRSRPTEPIVVGETSCCALVFEREI